MPKDNGVYRYSRQEAQRTGELNAWVESYSENCTCAHAIEHAIRDGYNDSRLDRDCAKQVLAEYGFDRVNWVLANTIREGGQDGRYSKENKEWARQFSVPQDDNFRNDGFAVHSHPGLVDIFANIVRREWQALALYEGEQCYPERLNFKGKIVAIRPICLKDAYKSGADQLFFAEGGFGCDPNAIGRKVYGRFVKDGERAWFMRDEIQGVVKLELLPDWAKEKQAEWANIAKEQIGMEEI